jgi:predicted nucleotidyltransferase
MADPHLELIIETLKTEFKCHTALLYGSRARGLAGPVSDYDVVGVRKRGAKKRIAKKVNGIFWDLFVYSDKDLKKLDTRHLTWRNAKVLFQKGQSGDRLVRRIQKLVKKPFKANPHHEIEITIAWAEKQIDRIAVGDVQGLFRRAELQSAAIEHYFQIRRKRFWGPKAGFQWLKKNDPTVFRLFKRMYENPDDEKALKALVKTVYRY